MKGTWWQAVCLDPRMPGGLHGAQGLSHCIHKEDDGGSRFAEWPPLNFGRLGICPWTKSVKDTRTFFKGKMKAKVLN